MKLSEVKLVEKMEKGMKQGIQTNFPNEMIQKYGCYFLALLKWAEIATEQEYDNEAVLGFYHEFVRRGWIRETCYVNNAVAILNFCIGETRYTNSQWIGVKPANENMVILQLTKPGYEHYVLGIEANGAFLMWDSLDPMRAAARDYKINLYGVFNG